MSDIVVLAHRNPTRPQPRLTELFISLCTVPGFPAAAAQLWHRQGMMACLLNPSHGASFDEEHVALGVLVKHPVLSVTFHGTEIVAQNDFFGSRPVWYVSTSEFFALSTSQFCIATLLNDVQLNYDVISWFLSSGFVGHASYDKRIKRLPANSKLRCDIGRQLLEISSLTKLEDPHFSSFDEMLSTVINEIKVERPVVVPISGGVDSRIILSSLAEREKDKIKAVTWGRPGALDLQEGDAFVAREVCKRLGVDFYFLEEPTKWDDAEQAMAQYVTYSEGMLDHLHMQNLRPTIASWCMQQQVGCMIRGDEIFGSRPVLVERDARRSIDLFSADEVGRTWPELSDLWQAQRPIKGMSRHSNEGPMAYRDRIYRLIRCPGVLACLNGAFARHVEIVNPLLDRRIFDFVEGLPEAERTKKRTFLQYAVKRMPDVKFAQFGSISEPRDLLDREEVRGYLQDRIVSRDARELFGSRAVERMDRELGRPRRSITAGAYSGSGLLGALVRQVGRERLLALRTAVWSYPGVEPSRMALRAVTAMATITRLHEAVRRGKEARAATGHGLGA